MWSINILNVEEVGKRRNVPVIQHKMLNFPLWNWKMKASLTIWLTVAIILQSSWTHTFHISMWGFSAPTRTSRVTIWLRQEGNFVQHILVSQCSFKLLEFDHSQIVLNIFKYSTTLEKGFLVIILTIMFKLWLHPDSFAKCMTSSTDRGCSFASRLSRPRIITQKLF